MTILKLQERGSAKPHQLRRDGIVPMGLVLLGKGTRMVQALDTDVRKALSHTTGARILDVQMEGESKKSTVMVKQVDREVITGKILTVTFAEISKTEAVTADVPVVPLGTPEPVSDGLATLGHPTSHLKVKGIATDLPASIDIDVSAMQIGDSISAGDVTLPEGIELVSSSDATLFSVQITRAHVDDEAPSEEGAADEAATESGDSSE